MAFGWRATRTGACSTTSSGRSATGPASVCIPSTDRLSFGCRSRVRPGSARSCATTRWCLHLRHNRLMAEGRVEGIYIKPAAGEMPRPVEEVKAMAGEGLEGDPYVAAGDFGEPGRGHQLTLI